MSFTSLLTQTVTYWAVSGKNAYGEETFASPVTFNARWQHINDLIINVDGQEIVASTIVYTTSQLDENAFLFLGTSVAADPRTVTDAIRIKKSQWSQTPNASTVVYKSIA